MIHKKLQYAEKLNKCSQLYKEGNLHINKKKTTAVCGTFFRVRVPEVRGESEDAPHIHTAPVHIRADTAKELDEDDHVHDGALWPSSSHVH